MDAPAPPALLAANRRLYELRSQAQTAGEQAAAHGAQRLVDAPATALPASCLRTAASRSPAAALPPHLGWGSEGLTAVLRKESATAAQAKTVQAEISPAKAYLSAGASAATRPGNGDNSAGQLPDSQLAPDNRRPPDAAVKLYPDIGLGMLRRGLAAPGRLWLLLRCLDTRGKGSFRIVVLEKTITDKNSPYYLCGRRQLRNLLKAGEGVFWQRDREHLWLRAAARVAYNLGVVRLTGQPVAFPLTALLGGIGQFRAELYAAFHSGRIRSRPQSQRARPISRRTLANLSGVGRSSQRSYERQTKVAVSSNFAVGAMATDRNREERAWQQGTAVFTLTDHKGQQGPAGQSYLAWQLPNNYAGRHQQRPKGRQRRINRQLKDLVMQGMPGNVDQTMAAPQMARLPDDRVFHRDGGQAAKAYGHCSHQDHYWPSRQRENLWHVAAGTNRNG